MVHRLLACTRYRLKTMTKKTPYIIKALYIYAKLRGVKMSPDKSKFDDKEESK